MTEFPPVWPRFVPKTWLSKFDHPESETPPRGYLSWDDYWAWIARGGALTIFQSPGTVPHGHKVQVTWTRDEEDVATIGMHFILAPGGDAIDWDVPAFERVEDNFNDVWDALKGRYSPDIQLARYVWHRWGVNVRRPNPAVRETNIVTPVAGTGDAHDQLPPQTAVSVTFKTAVRKNWGRVYMPAPTDTDADDGRVSATLVGLMQSAFGAFADDQASHDCPLVIWSPRHDGKLLSYGDGSKAGRAAAHEARLDDPDSSSFARTVDVIQVDDIFDTIRSRRYARPAIRSRHTVGP